MSEHTNGQAIIIWGTTNKGLVFSVDSSAFVPFFVCILFYGENSQRPLVLTTSFFGRKWGVLTKGIFPGPEARTYPWVISRKPAW